MEQLDFGFEDRCMRLDKKEDPLVKLNSIIARELFRPRLKKVWREPEGERTSRRMSGSRSEIPAFAEAPSGIGFSARMTLGGRFCASNEDARAQYQCEGLGCLHRPRHITWNYHEESSRSTVSS